VSTSGRGASAKNAAATAPANTCGEGTGVKTVVRRGSIVDSKKKKGWEVKRGTRVGKGAVEQEISAKSV